MLHREMYNPRICLLRSLRRTVGKRDFVLHRAKQIDVQRHVVYLATADFPELFGRLILVTALKNYRPVRYEATHINNVYTSFQRTSL